MKACDGNIKKTLALVEKMITLADTGDIDREDVGCGILYGILRDSAFKIKKIAEREKENHIKKRLVGICRGKKTPHFFSRYPSGNENFCSRSRPAKKITAGISLIFRG